MPLVPQLENRTLRISEDLTGFEYQYEICAKRIIFCVKKQMKIDKYPFSNKEVMNALKEKGFKLIRTKDPI